MTPAPYLRRAFTVAKPVVSARLYVTALGLYEMRLNGQKVGDAFLAPGWTDYSKRRVWLADGTREWIVTDGQWQGRFGAIRHADLLMGECHDLALEPSGWDAPGDDQGDGSTGDWDTGAWRDVACRPATGARWWPTRDPRSA